MTSEITEEFTNRTLSRGEQEISVYKTLDEPTYWISTTIPKYARKYEKRLVKGRKVYNKKTGNLVELHGLTDSKTLTLAKPSTMSDEQRQKASIRMQQIQYDRAVREADERGY